MSDLDPDLGISRLDQPSVGTHGWQVRLQRKGVRYGRFFSDAAWGGKRAALETARIFRDRIVAGTERRSVAARVSPRSHTVPSSRSRSGVVGVSRIIQRSAGREYHFWQASWTSAGGRRQAVRFSVLKYGDETAFELACLARRKALD